MRDKIMSLIYLLFIGVYSKLEKEQIKNNFLINIKTGNKKIDKPVIGIYGNANPENDTIKNDNSYYAQPYIMWLSEFGAETMAIHHWYTESELDVILSKVSGVLFMGGGRDFMRGELWEKNALYILNYAKSNSLPVWGTCQGFQLIGTLFSDDYKLLKDEFENMEVLEKVTLTEKGKSGKTKMYKLFNDKDFNILTNEDSTIYFHTFAFYPNEWDANENLKALFYVTGKGFDINNKEFVNSFEGIDSLILATQYHPEKVPFKRYNYLLPHNTNALKVSQLLGIQFVDYARKYQKEKDKYFDEEDRDIYDFFYLHKAQPRANYVYNEETYYFKKK